MRKLLATVFGGSCYLCRGAATGLLCAPCESELPRLPDSVCPRCALPSPGAALCGACLARPPGFDATFAALWYEFPADALVLALKFRSELSLAPFFSDLLAERVRAERFDCMMPVPLSPRRLRTRGYNQAAEIARGLAARVGARLELQLCERVRETPAQSDLPWAERRRNVRGAFECRRALPGAVVAVVDDVMTTASTLDEIAAVLKRAGAARVVNCVAARTPPPHV